MGWRITFDGTKRQISDEERLVELKAHPYRSIWEGGKVVDFDDLPPELFDKIAAEEQNSDVNWWVIYRSPGGQGARLHKVIHAAATFAGVEPPSKPSNMRESMLLLERIERTEDPTEGSETETDSSTGPSEDSTGARPKSVKNGSATS